MDDIIELIAALFTVARKWKQYGCPSTDGHEDVVHIYTMGFIQHKRKIKSAGRWMELEIIVLSEISQTEKGKDYMLTLICGV